MAADNTLKALMLSSILLALLPLANAAVSLPTHGPSFDQVLVNSNDWQDIYSGLLFARLTGKPGDYVLSPGMAPDVVASLSPKLTRVLLIEPARNKQYPGLRELLREQGFTIVDVPGSADYNRRLLGMFDPKGLIITDPRYPYNAISLAPYALQRRSYVLFADAASTDELSSAIAEHDVPLTAYGIIDTAVEQAISSHDPTIIDEGGKFDNNIRVVKDFLSEDDVQQVVLTNGEFIEESLITDFNPVLFIGRSNVPEQTERFMGESDIKTAVVVGNYLADVADNLKRSLKKDYGKDVSFIVKFAKTPRVSGSTFSTPTSLEYFALPIIAPRLNVSGITYNKLTKKLEVTYENPSPIAAFFISSITVTADGQEYSVGDNQSRAISGGQQKTLLYDLDTQAQSIDAEAFVIYGDYPDSLELSVSRSFQDIPIIQVADYSEIEIRDLVYDRADQAFYITLRNPGDVNAFANVELVDIIVDGLPTTLGTRTVASIAPGATEQVYVRAKLSDLDIKENEHVVVRASYGQREEVLSKRQEQTMTLKVRLLKPLYLAGAGALILIILSLVLLIGRKRTFVCDRCGHRIRARSSPSRHACGGHFKRS